MFLDTLPLSSLDEFAEVFSLRFSLKSNTRLSDSGLNIDIDETSLPLLSEIVAFSDKPEPMTLHYGDETYSTLFDPKTSTFLLNFPVLELKPLQSFISKFVKM